MINKIIGTIGTRFYVGIILLLILGLHSKYLGPEVLGQIAIFKIAASINHLFGSVFSGPSIVYLANRISINKLVVPAFFWVIGSTILLSIVQTLLHLVSPHYFWHLVVFSILLSTQTFLEQVLLSRQFIKSYNFSTFLHHTVLYSACAMLIFYSGWKTEQVFFYSSYAAFLFSILFLFGATWEAFDVSQFAFNARIARIVFNYGFWVQVNNFVQTLNYRVSLLLLDKYWGKTAVGYFSAALQLAEAIWIVAKSLATVQYARIAANRSRKYAIDLTLILSKVSFFLSVSAAIMLVIIPEETLGYYLGEDFTHVKKVILCLIPGILFFSISLIYCHYFSGQGRFYFNFIGSGISLIIIISLGWFFIPKHGMHVAALINSAGLLGMFIYYVLILTIKEKISPLRLLPARYDLKRSYGIIREYLRRD